MADTKAPPAPPEAISVYVPVPSAAATPAVTADWTKPGTEAPEKPTSRKAGRRRGIPAGPALAAVGNAATIAATSAYSAGGWPALAAAGGVLVAGGAAAVGKRRKTVKRRTLAARAGRQGGTGSWSSPSSRSSRGGAVGSGLGGHRTGAGGTAKPSRSSASPGSPSRQGSPGTVSRKQGSRSGAGSSASLRRLADRLLGGTGKTAKADSAKVRKRKEKAKSAAAQQSRLARTAKAARVRAGNAWAADRPRRQRNRAAAKVALSKARTAAADALRAARAGLWGAIRHRSWAKGGQRALAAWKNRHAKRTPAPAAPTVASTVRRPASTAPASTPGARTMPGHHFVAPAMEAAAAAAAYSPTGMMQVGQDFAGLQQALELNAEAMKVTVENADAKFPIAPQIVEMMRQIHQLQLKAAEMAKELQPAFHKLHQVDIARIEQPRKGVTGERMWDVSSNL